MNKKPIFDAVRTMLGRGFKPAEIKVLDRACSLAGATGTRPTAFRPNKLPDPHWLGSLSAIYESGNRGPGAVSNGAGDPGGASYGVYQLSSKAGTLGTFLKAEGKCWVDEFGACKPGNADFNAAWKAIAAREPDAFRKAQHAFIERTHYRPAVAAILERNGLNLDIRSQALRDVTWSVAVQHAGAVKILLAAISTIDPKIARDEAGYDKVLIEAIYAARTNYVLGVAANLNLPIAQRKLLTSIIRNRFPKERVQALAMLRKAPLQDSSYKLSVHHSERIYDDRVAI